MADKVLCLVVPQTKSQKEILNQIWDQEYWLDDVEVSSRVNGMINDEVIVPLIDHPHNDIENGQKEIHYHIDDRYMGSRRASVNGFSIVRVALPLKEGRLEYRMLEKEHDLINTTTPTELIKNSKLKHKCIHKGKCPHRGYDLSSEKAVDGVITCPLHGLKFDKSTGKLKK